MSTPYCALVTTFIFKELKKHETLSPCRTALHWSQSSMENLRTLFLPYFWFVSNNYSTRNVFSELRARTFPSNWAVRPYRPVGYGRCSDWALGHESDWDLELSLPERKVLMMSQYPFRDAFDRLPRWVSITVSTEFLVLCVRGWDDPLEETVGVLVGISYSSRVVGSASWRGVALSRCSVEQWVPQILENPPDVMNLPSLPFS